jgi:predicted TIM-barrel fold metal-dependent hydrolase
MWEACAGLGLPVNFHIDFPHPTCLYPDPLSRAAEPLVGVEPDVRRKLLSTNAATLYRIPLAAAS